MHIITQKKLQEFWALHPDAQQPLKAWYCEAKHAEWKSPDDIKLRYASASILNDNRVVFNIGGNKYRLIVKIAYQIGCIYVRFLGTHAQYNKIDAENI